MNEANRLVLDIAENRRQLHALERQLKQLQESCKHYFIDQTTHRICRHCQVVENYHY